MPVNEHRQGHRHTAVEVLLVGDQVQTITQVFPLPVKFPQDRAMVQLCDRAVVGNDRHVFSRGSDDAWNARVRVLRGDKPQSLIRAVSGPTQPPEIVEVIRVEPGQGGSVPVVDRVPGRKERSARRADFDERLTLRVVRVYDQPRQSQYDQADRDRRKSPYKDGKHCHKQWGIMPLTFQHLKAGSHLHY